MAVFKDLHQFFFGRGERLAGERRNFESWLSKWEVLVREGQTIRTNYGRWDNRISS